MARASIVNRTETNTEPIEWRRLGKRCVKLKLTVKSVRVFSMADEVDADAPVLVIDLGSGVIKAGWAGEDTPRFTAPSVVARVKQNTSGAPDIAAVNFNEDLLTGSYAIRSVTEHPNDLELVYPIDRQEVTDWNAITQTLERLYSRYVPGNRPAC